MRIPPATVRFIGNEDDYVLSCDGEMKYCRDCRRFENCAIDRSLLVREFSEGELYEGYALGSWCGEYRNLYVMTNTGEPDGYIDSGDFEVVEDEYGALEKRIAKVRCLKSDSFDMMEGDTYDASGVVYQSIPFDRRGIIWYVADFSGDHYPTLPDFFEIESDPHHVLDRRKGRELFWWDGPSLSETFRGDDLSIDYKSETDTLTIKLRRLPFRCGSCPEQPSFELFCDKPEIHVAYNEWSAYPAAFRYVGFRENLGALLDVDCFMPKLLALNTLPPVFIELPDDFNKVLGMERMDFVNTTRSAGVEETLVSRIHPAPITLDSNWEQAYQADRSLGKRHSLESMLLDYLHKEREPKWYASSGGFLDVVSKEHLREPLVAYAEGPWGWTSQDVYHFEKYHLSLRPAFIEYVKKRMKPWRAEPEEVKDGA